ncbi:hypothetical protein H0H93_013065 [Arthromyces matolae]|nr:hypothetical protein H0H93_013065 [Arthromyces matolae]
MAPSNKPKNRTKPQQGRPSSTSAISQPVVEDASHLTALSSFSPDGNLFSFLSLAVDKHRLRVYSTVTGQSVAEHIIESARVSSATWGTFDPSEGQNASSTTEASPTKKKRRKRDAATAEEQSHSATIQTVILGLSDGSILLFSPNHGRIIRTLSHPSSNVEVLAVEMVQHSDKSSTLWTSGADGTVRLWDAKKNEIVATWKNDDRIPYTFLAARPSPEEGRMDVLAAHHSIRLLSSATTDAQKPKELAAFTGHASSIRQLQWDASKTPSTRFVSLAEADRFVYIWEVPEDSSTEGKAIASIPLDSDSRILSFSIPQKLPRTSTSRKQTLLTLSASGKISIFPVPSELATSANSKQKLSTLLSRSILAASSKTASTAKVINAAFVPENNGAIRVARLVGGIRPVFDVVVRCTFFLRGIADIGSQSYLDDSGEFIPEVVLEDVKDVSLNDQQSMNLTQRYAEGASLAVGSGVQLGQDEEMDDLALRNVDGDLDVDLAELSLGQRLTALSGEAERQGSESDDEVAPKAKSSKRKSNSESTLVPANSLTRTLIQALHSSDTRLLETCLAHSDQSLIRNTVRNLPPQLAVPLITACVERLGRGARAGNMKGGGGGASSQRGAGLITWVKTALTVHSGYLMTVCLVSPISDYGAYVFIGMQIPDLVARLSGLHATLTSRLTLQESLLSLNGRLDMVISQIELRSSAAPAPLAPKKGKKTSETQTTEVTRYVEGESEDESDDAVQMEVEVESGDEEGSVEDVELGGDSDEEEMSEEDDEEEEEDDDDDDPTMNGFIDDEAEEWSDDDEAEESD